MQDMLREVFNVNLSTRAQAFLTFVDNADPCFLGLVVVVLVLLGSRMVAGQPQMRNWGLRFAAGTFLLYFSYKYAITDIGSDHKQLIGIGLRSACMAGVVLAFTWIIVPVALFVLGHIRLAAAAFLVFGGYLLISAKEVTQEQMPFFAFQAALASGLALLVAWILEPMWNYLSENWLPERKKSKNVATTLTPEQVPPEMVIPIPTEQPSRQSRARSTMLAAPSELSAELREDLETLRERDAKRRREKARLQLELLYVQVAPLIGDWFTRETYDQFVQKHLGDHLPAGDVEENARQLRGVLEQQMEQSKEEEGFASMEELTRWLLAEQQRIQSQSAEAPVKQSQMLELQQKYLTLATKLVKNQTALPAL